jgi:hypothetical protein
VQRGYCEHDGRRFTYRDGYCDEPCRDRCAGSAEERAHCWRKTQTESRARNYATSIRDRCRRRWHRYSALPNCGGACLHPDETRTNHERCRLSSREPTRLMFFNSTCIYIYSTRSVVREQPHLRNTERVVAADLADSAGPALALL